MKNFYIFLLLSGIHISSTLTKQYEQQFKNIVLSDQETSLIQHVKQSIILADQNFSKLPGAILAVKGMTSPKVKHLLNNLCTLPQNRYLEIGVWKGATFTAALHGNKDHIKEAVAIDNWSEFEGPEAEFKTNCAAFIKDVPYKFYSDDSFKIKTNNLFKESVNIYFYDGYHSALAQEQAFTYYNDIFASTFIALVDDWNCIEAQEGTLAAFEKLGYTVLFECVLPARYNGDMENWWNGLYVAVVRK